MNHRKFLFIALLLLPSTLFAGEYLCDIENNQVVVKEKGSELARIDINDAISCLFYEENIYIARGSNGIEIYKFKDKKAEKVSSVKTTNEVIGFNLISGKIYAISAIFSQIPIIKSSDGNFYQGSISNDVFSGKIKGVISGEATQTKAKEEEKKESKRIQGEVIEITPGYAIINLGSKDGIEKNMRFEIQSSELKKIYNLKTRTYEMMPSLETTAVSPVVQVSEDRCMIRIGRGNKAHIGDIAILTEKPLSESLYTPSYEKGLHRIYGRIAPFVGIETLTIGSLLSLMYDYTFEFPLKIEGGIRNAGILFSTKNTSPFQLDIIPSYNTDLFEVGLGTGYTYSGHELQRNFLFLQKVRLGAVDGINFTMWNSFIYQEKHSLWNFYGHDSGSVVKNAGDPCTPDKDREYEFAWNGFDMEATTPVSKSINLFTHWAYSQAGWFTGEIGIKNFVKGNGGDGTLIIPVSIGGTGVFDYKSEKSSRLVCNPDTKKLEYDKEWSTEGFGGPIVSIGIDYRWK